MLQALCYPAPGGSPLLAKAERACLRLVVQMAIRGQSAFAEEMPGIAKEFSAMDLGQVVTSVSQPVEASNLETHVCHSLALLAGVVRRGVQMPIALPELSTLNVLEDPDWISKFAAKFVPQPHTDALSNDGLDDGSEKDTVDGNGTGTGTDVTEKRPSEPTTKPIRESERQNKGKGGVPADASSGSGSNPKKRKPNPAAKSKSDKKARTDPWAGSELESEPESKMLPLAWIVETDVKPVYDLDPVSDELEPLTVSLKCIFYQHDAI